MLARLFCFVFLLVAAVSLHAQERVLQVFRGPEREERIERAVYLAGGVELAASGLSSAMLRYSPTDDSTIGAAEDAPDDRSALLDIANLLPYFRVPNWDYVLSIGYTRADSRLSVEMDLYESESGALLAAAETTAEIDFELDSAIAAAVRDLIAEAGIADSSVRGELEGVAPFLFVMRPEEPDEAPEGTAAPRDPELPLPPVLPEMAPAPPRAQGAEISVLGSALVMLGEATSLFRYGAGAALSTGYAFPLERSAVTLSGRVSANRVFSDEGVQGGRVFLWTFGPEIQLGTPSRAPSRSGLRASAGASVVTVDRPAGALHKTVPYVDIGANTRLPLGKRSSLGGEVSLLAVFEGDMPLTAIATSFMLTLEP